ncbi:hypothetical protein [Lactobacillus delbrueckii]|uniref:hypothetical protein n=1 Tax=Lactobacillus delbrueckii TaxID=1584 RepID=UPI003851C7B7
MARTCPISGKQGARCFWFLPWACLLEAFGNIYFASHQAMQVGQRLRAMLFAKVLTLSDEESAALASPL